ncbi:HAMP domain-containing sensor histidine kinase [Gryllotalpicola koreensis]|uniref:histidine kinase n=1 Tax=Gryllotalpicola koreensis TaxID=993086 RepID=A0ABP7ZS64_9MICO
MRTDPSGLRSVSLRLALRFAGLIVALFLIVAGVVITLVTTSEHEAVKQSLASAARLDSPRDAPAGVYVAILGGPGQPGQAPPGDQQPQDQDQVAVSPNAPSGFPDLTVLERVASTHTVVQKNETIDGISYVVRTSFSAGRAVQVAVNLSDSQAEVRRVIIALALAGVPAIAGAVLAAWWMSRRAMRPLAEALALQRRFVADAGHELRTPLTLLSTRAQILQRSLGAAPHGEQPALQPTPAADTVRDGLDEIVSDAKALTGILEDLLISADPRQDAERVTLDLALVADEVAAGTSAEAGERGIAIARTGDAAVTVSGVRVSLARLILALVSNALDHARTRVEITVSKHGKETWLEVRDDGPGFPAGAAERVFERFASTRAAETGGSGQRHYGLGLALVAEVAHRHDGSVEIVDTGGRGALVRVRLPLISQT